jgi:pimeloyl-ACP methyl ester carboxylesterase
MRLRRFLIGCSAIALILSLVLISFLAYLFLSFKQEYRSPTELADPDGAFMQVNGASLYYIAKGDNENPAVIFIHGFGGSSFTWRDNLQAIAEAGFYVVALDLPPFGLSDKSATIGYSRRDLAAYVAGLMDNLDIETASVLGHSMGATVASYFAVNYPERLEKLILVDGGIIENREPSNSGNSPLAFLRTIDLNSPLAAEILRVSLRPDTFEDIMQSAYYDPSLISDEMVAGYARPLQIEEWPYGFIGFLQTEQTQTLRLQDLAEQIEVPILIIWGEGDSWIPIEQGQAMAAVLDEAGFISYPNVGHLPMEENVEGFNTDLIAFLRESN